eukprot:scaffold22.g6097.t1
MRTRGAQKRKAEESGLSREEEEVRASCLPLSAQSDRRWLKPHAYPPQEGRARAPPRRRRQGAKAPAAAAQPAQPKPPPRPKPKGAKPAAAEQAKNKGKAKGKGRSKAASSEGEEEEGESVVKINRAPVLTLWAAVVAQREGRTWDEGLTYGRWISGIMAHSKGVKLGVYEAKEKTEEEAAARRARDAALGVDAFGMRIPAVEVVGERHAVSEGKAISPASVAQYLKRAFRDRLEDVKAAMEELAAAVPPARIGARAYGLYEQLRPEWRGWGANGELSLAAIRRLAQEEEGTAEA